VERGTAPTAELVEVVVVAAAAAAVVVEAVVVEAVAGEDPCR
jgi:hypothetical protein